MKNYSERLKYRPLEMTDVDWLMEWENEPTHWSVSDRQLPLNRSVFRQYIGNATETLQEAGQFRWVMEDVATGDPVGLLDLYNYSERHQRAFVGVLIHANFRNKGMALEGLNWLKEYANKVAALHQLFAEIGSLNTQSIRTFESAGYVQCGELKDWIRRKDGFESVRQYQLML